MDLLKAIGGLLGVTYKVDPITESQARGRFTRICVEIDITKPLKSSLDIDNRAIRVEYESLGLICFQCGRVGHSKDSCVEIDKSCNGGDSVPVVESGPSSSKLDSTVKGDKIDSFGPWVARILVMLVL